MRCRLSDDSSRLALPVRRRRSENVANRSLRNWQELAWKFDPAYRQLHATGLASRRRARICWINGKPKLKAETGARVRTEVVLYLVARDASPGDRRHKSFGSGRGFEAARPPSILLRDLRQVGGQIRSLHRNLFAGIPRKYLMALSWNCRATPR